MGGAREQQLPADFPRGNKKIAVKSFIHMGKRFCWAEIWGGQKIRQGKKILL